MIRENGKAALGEAQFHDVTALTDPQVRALLKRGVVQMELFEETPAKVETGGRRLILRCNPATRERRNRPGEPIKWQCVRNRISARNERWSRSPG